MDALGCISKGWELWNEKEVFTTDIPLYDMTFTPKAPLQATQNDG